mmetsp:Transcript_35186/g.101154  ORF Transcript_35186/g.101154 Transcript_35186/m.101154 type:complete len:106 (-) Transcript_35186:2458-2775(-)
MPVTLSVCVGMVCVSRGGGTAVCAIMLACTEVSQQLHTPAFAPYAARQSGSMSAESDVSMLIDTCLSVTLISCTHGLNESVNPIPIQPSHTRAAHHSHQRTHLSV